MNKTGLHALRELDRQIDETYRAALRGENVMDNVFLVSTMFQRRRELAEIVAPNATVLPDEDRGAMMDVSERDDRFAGE